MGKKILLVTGSPRAKGNTDLLAQAFQEGAEQAGHQVTVFDAGKRTSCPAKPAIPAIKRACPAASPTISTSAKSP